MLEQNLPEPWLMEPKWLELTRCGDGEEEEKEELDHTDRYVAPRCCRTGRTM
jgi:hypothetical protein